MEQTDKVGETQSADEARTIAEAAGSPVLYLQPGENLAQKRIMGIYVVFEK
jgi:hypothetical protein